MEVTEEASRPKDQDTALLVHRFNSELPYRESIPGENDRLLAEISGALASFDPARDDALQVLQACAGLARMRDLKFSIDGASRLDIARALHALAFPAPEAVPLPSRCVNKVISALARLIGKKQGRLALEGRLVLPWRPMLSALNECSPGGFPTGAFRHERTKVAALVQLVREARRYWAPGADREVWEEVREEIAQVKTHGAVRALYVLCLFMPSCPGIYDELLPTWFSLWGRIDHCPSWDGAWLTLLCRARKHASLAFDWTPYMPDIYSFARASIHTPVSMGDAGAAPLPGLRQVAHQFQAICPTASRTFGATLAKVGKLLVFLLGKGGPADLVRVSDVAIVPPTREDVGEGDMERSVSPAALHLLSLFRGLRTYFHPSNGGRWSGEMGILMNCVLHNMVVRVGAEGALREVGRSPQGGELTRDDTGLVVEALLPLALEMVYSKSTGIGTIANYCLANLAALSPKSVAPASAELILSALDPVASINHPHQPTAAIRALTAIFRWVMYPRPYLAPYLPALLELTLPGIDANDVFKTTITLQLYHLILCWVPVQSNPVRFPAGALDGWKPPPSTWLDSGSADATNSADEDELYTACESLGGAMMEWSVAVLDRIFEVLRHKDKSSKVKAGDLASDTMNVAAAMTGLGGGGRGGGGGGMSIASMVGGGRSDSLLTGLIAVVAQQLFSMADEPAAKIASTRVLRFVKDRPLPNAEKDVAAMVAVMTAARPAETVASFFPALCDGLLATNTPIGSTPVLTPGTSLVLLRWRLRLLSGLASGAGVALLPHGPTLRRLIAAGIKHVDKGVRKSARKLLRKALLGLCELRSAEMRSLPPARWANADSVVEWRRLCEPISPGEHDIKWVEPSPEGLALAADLLEDFLARPMQDLSQKLSRERAEEEGATASVWREHLKTMQYALRGGTCLLNDRGTPGEDDDSPAKHLRDDVYLAVGSRNLSRLLLPAAGKEGPRLYRMVAGLRAEIARFTRVSLEACVEGKGPADVKAAKLTVDLSNRIACTRGAKAHHARRLGMTLAAFKSLQTDSGAGAAGKVRFTLALEAAANGDAAAAVDAQRALDGAGLGGGLTRPRALAVARVSLQHWKRLAMAPRAMAYAAKKAVGSRSGTPDTMEYTDASITPWAAAPAVLDRYRSLFAVLVKLSSSEYAMVRAAAQVGVSRIGGVFPWFVRETVPDLISRLSPCGQEGLGGEGAGGGGDAAHRRLTGACYLLHQTRSMRYVASKWSLSRALLLTLCDSQPVLARLPADKQEKAAARVTILFNSYVSSWMANTIVSENDKAEHDALSSGLLERLAAFGGAAPSAGGGWRYQLMASWCLMHLIRPSGDSAHIGPDRSSSAATSLGQLPPPMAVWRWFAECLSEGDGQPLQRLAIAALQRLLASADQALPGGSDVCALLCSPAFLRPLLLALAHNHKQQATEGGLGGTEQWSLGVKEILQDAGRGNRRLLFPRLRFTTRSNLFWPRNARLVSSVVSAVAEGSRAECIRILLKQAADQKRGVAHEDKRSFDCAAAEVGAGVMAMLVGDSSWSERERVLRETALPYVETEVEGISLEGRLDWNDAIRFVLDHGTLEGSEPLVSWVVEKTAAVLQDGGKGRDDYSVLVKWLSFSGAVLIEMSAREATAPRAEEIAKVLCPLLVEGLDHPFKACRGEIASNLFMVTNATNVAWAARMADGVRESILAEAARVEEDRADKDEEVTNGVATLSVMDPTNTPEDADSALLASAMAMSDGTPTEEQEAAAAGATKRLSLRRETVLQWVNQTVCAGDHARYLPILAALVPVVLECVRDTKVEVAALGRGTCLSSAAALALRTSKGATNLGNLADAGGADSDTVGGVMNAVLAAASSQSSWRVRRNAAAVACVLQTRLHFLLTPEQHRAADATLLSLLGDARLEVQETARLALSTRVAHLTAAETRVLCEKFAAGADSAAASRKKRRKIAKRQATAAAAGGGATVAIAAGEPSGAMKEQQVNVLGLSAVVLAAPCDVPPWVPGALESLSRHAHDESPGRVPVRQTVKNTFKEFRRTHQDKWEESHKARFSRDELDTFEDVLGGALSYFI